MKNLLILNLLILGSIITCNAQNELELEALFNEAFTQVDKPPTFDGGMTAYYEYITSNLTYPAKAKKEGVEGKVFVEFIITKTGSIASARVLKGIGERCDNAAISIINNAPKWTPGSNKGVPVNVKMVLPITFKLD